MPKPQYPARIMRAPLASLSLTLALLAPAAHAEIRAVVVGVSDYLTLDADLKGPANDARLMAETLIARGVDPQKITVLTSDPSGLPAGTGTGQPNRAEILAALDAATQASVQDDASASALVQQQPSVIKRPVVEWQDAQGLHVTVGFVPDQWPAGPNRASKG